MSKVVILQHRLLHYRVGLFERLRERCLEHGIKLHLVYGQPTRRELLRNDVGSIAWADVVTNHYLEIGERDLLWQPFPVHLRDANLVVMMQESRLISNYPLLVSRLWSKRKLAYWGHGQNFQSDSPSGFSERWKRMLVTKVDWWFAYTQVSVDVVASSGYPLSQITCLNNAVDTDAFKSELFAVTENELDSVRNQMGIAEYSPVGLFCGSLYPDKRLDFLVDSIDIIRSKSANFHCIILGDGPSMYVLREAASSRPWLHLLGVTKGAKKALYFRMADFMLNPGLVGLHIVDAFCSGLVLVTTSGAKHSPEIAYLKNDVNGIMTSNGVGEYARGVLNLIEDKSRLKRLKLASLKAADELTLDKMVGHFVAGILSCLKHK